MDLIQTNCPRSFQNSCPIETGLSDFHELLVTDMMTTCKKITVNYRSYKYYNYEIFREELQQLEANENNNDESFKNFTSSCNAVLNKHLQYVRGNQSPSMKKTLSETIMQRFKLRNLFLKMRTEQNRNNYFKQRNFCVALLRKRVFWEFK